MTVIGSVARAHLLTTGGRCQSRHRACEPPKHLSLFSLRIGAYKPLRSDVEMEVVSDRCCSRRLTDFTNERYHGFADFSAYRILVLFLPLLLFVLMLYDSPS